MRVHRLGASSGEDASTARKPSERSEGDHGHADGKFDGQTTGFRQGATAGGTLEFWTKVSSLFEKRMVGLNAHD